MTALNSNLVHASERLNSSSDAFGRATARVEIVLKRLNLGVSAWVTFGEKTDDRSFTAVGYDKVNGAWGLGIATVDGDGNRTVWTINDAPRRLRLGAVECLPHLFDALAVTADVVSAQMESAINILESVYIPSGGAR